MWLFATIIYGIFCQMIVQIYLEIPNGQKLAKALHSKVVLILGNSIIIIIILFLTHDIVFCREFHTLYTGKIHFHWR